MFPHEKAALKSNFEILQRRVQHFKRQQESLAKDLKEANVHSRYLDREMNALKPEIIQLYKQRQQHQTWLVAHGRRVEEVSRLLEQWSVEQQHGGPGGDAAGSLSPTSAAAAAAANPAPLSSSSAAASSAAGDTVEMPQDTWLMPEVDRVRADQLLAGRQHGTFLIRRSRDGRYALSIMCGGTVGHCHIEQTERGFGFAEPYNIYPTLAELVAHYSKNSLEEHNDLLKTTLTFPVGLRSQQQQQQQQHQENTYIEPHKL